MIQYQSPIIHHIRQYKHVSVKEIANIFRSIINLLFD